MPSHIGSKIKSGANQSLLEGAPSTDKEPCLHLTHVFVLYTFLFSVNRVERAGVDQWRMKHSSSRGTAETESRRGKVDLLCKGTMRKPSRCDSVLKTPYAGTWIGKALYTYVSIFTFAPRIVSISEAEALGKGNLRHCVVDLNLTTNRRGLLTFCSCPNVAYTRTFQQVFQVEFLLRYFSYLGIDGLQIARKMERYRDASTGKWITGARATFKYRAQILLFKFTYSNGIE